MTTSQDLGSTVFKHDEQRIGTSRELNIEVARRVGHDPHDDDLVGMGFGVMPEGMYGSGQDYVEKIRADQELYEEEAYVDSMTHGGYRQLLSV